jgi:hypothetical protein
MKFLRQTAKRQAVSPTLRGFPVARPQVADARDVLEIGRKLGTK